MVCISGGECYKGKYCQCVKCKKYEAGDSPEFDWLRGLVVAMLEEVQDKHLIDCIAETDLNQDHHIEITLTIGEIRKAAGALGIKSF